MIITELPYVSDFLKETIVRNGFELLKTNTSELLFNGLTPNFVSSPEAIELFKKDPNKKLFTNSENSINWIVNSLSFTDLPRQIDLFKNKVKFREFMANRYPNYFFKAIDYEKLNEIDISSFPEPFVIKPAVGFFSMGVYIVKSHKEWPKIVSLIKAEIEQVELIYPVEVFNHATFIAEEIIEGEEYAFDAYYNKNGEPVILNIFHHPFSSGDDVSDRVYLTNDEIVMSNLELFTDWLKDIGKEAKLHNFPLHVEVRINESGLMQAIEVNPLRFGGFCTTADATWFAYGFNSYEYYMNELAPDWNSIFLSRKDKLFSLLVLNNSTGVEGSEIKKFNYEKVRSKLEKVTELRQIDYSKFPLFGFVFAESRKENRAELDYLLHSDLKEFIIE